MMAEQHRPLPSGAGEDAGAGETGPLRGRYLSSEERRNQAIDVVIALAGQENPAEISTSDVARRMQLTQGALFRHFPSKDALLEAVMERVSGLLLARIARSAMQEETPLAKLRAMFIAHADFASEYPGVPRMLFGELQRAQDTPAKRIAKALLARYSGHLQELLEQGKRQQELPQTLDAEAAALLFIGTLQGLVMQSFLVGDVERIARYAPRVYAIYERGLRCR